MIDLFESLVNPPRLHLLEVVYGQDLQPFLVWFRFIDHVCVEEK